MTFDKLALHPSILKAIADSGYTTPTPIQAQAIPEALAGHDLMASAQTGTGKTAAFVLPSLQHLTAPATIQSRGPRVLVLTPTRELASQVTDAAAKYGKHLRFRIGSIVGGVSYHPQMRLLSQPVDILVATPGRLLDHMAAGRLDYSRLEVLVLDEADRMLDMGFIHAVEKIAAATPAKRQTLLFSATLEGNVAKLAHKLLKHPKRIQVASVQERHENIDQRLYHVRDGDHKRRLLAHLLDDHQVEKVIVFTATKHGADRLAKALHAQGHPAAALHGNMNQNQRNRAIAKLRSGEAELLVATDVAARGLDVTGISHVINYDLPKQPEDYVHRIGRTGRAGAKGLAISFVTSEERRQLRDIERYTKHSIPVAVVEGLAAHAPLGSGSRHRSTASVPGGERPHTAHAPARAGQGHPQQRAAHPRQGQPRREAHHAPRPAHHNANPGNQAQAPQHPKSGAPKRRKDGARRGASNFQQRLDTRPLFG